MFNTNNTLEQKVKASISTSLHREFIEQHIIIRPSEPDLYIYSIYIYSQTDTFTLGQNMASALANKALKSLLVV